MVGSSSSTSNNNNYYYNKSTRSPGEDRKLVRYSNGRRWRVAISRSTSGRMITRADLEPPTWAPDSVGVSGVFHKH